MKYNHEQIIELKKQLKEIEQQYYIENTLFHWEWWVLLFLTFAPWFIWWKLVDKKRVMENLLFGFFISTVTLTFDSLGTNLMWWDYPHELIEIMPPLAPIDLSVIPCLMMMVYQYFHSWKSYLIANTIFALLASYLGEDLFIWLDIYKPIVWEHFYSIFFYIISGVMGKWIILKLKK